MIQNLLRNWWPVSLCVALEAIISAIYFNNAEQGNHSTRAIVYLGELTLAAGVCTIAASILSSAKDKRWLLLLNGLTCSVLGLILTFWSVRIAFRTIALLIMIMALGLGLYELATAGWFRRHRAHEYLLFAAGVVSLAFAVVFFAFVFRWIKLGPASPAQTFLWLGSYFAFSAICMLGIPLHLRRSGHEDFPAFGDPA